MNDPLRSINILGAHSARRGPGKMVASISRRVFVFVAALAVVTVSQAQDKFPLRSGEWARNLKLAGAPSGRQLLYCMNDQLWTKALTQSPSCTIQTLSSTSAGITLSVDCQNPARQIKGKVNLTYDGMEHMSEKSSFQVTTNGTPSTVETTTDWTWKAAECSPTDINLRPLPPAH